VVVVFASAMSESRALHPALAFIASTVCHYIAMPILSACLLPYGGSASPSVARGQRRRGQRAFCMAGSVARAGCGTLGDVWMAPST